MGSEKYVGLDVHKDTISIAVMNSAGKLLDLQLMGFQVGSGGFSNSH